MSKKIGNKRKKVSQRRDLLLFRLRVQGYIEEALEFFPS